MFALLCAIAAGLLFGGGRSARHQRPVSRRGGALHGFRCFWPLALYHKALVAIEIIAIDARSFIAFPGYPPGTGT